MPLYNDQLVLLIVYMYNMAFLISTCLICGIIINTAFESGLELCARILTLAYHGTHCRHSMIQDIL